MKAILELDYIPVNCLDCVLSSKKIYGHETVWVCSGLSVRKEVNIDINIKDLPPFCPLKIIE